MTVIHFPNGEYEDITTGIVLGSLQIKKAIATSGELQFGGCISTQFSAELYNKDIKPSEIEVYQTRDDDVNVPLFRGYIDKAEESDSANTLIITAYDSFYAKGDTNVIEWYNSLDFGTLTLEAMLNSLLRYMGITREAYSMPQGIMPVSKTISSDSLTFHNVIKSICELNGGFGTITAEGKFKIVYLEDTQSELQVLSGYKYAKYNVERIDKVQLKAEEDDIGGIYGAGTNALIIQGNFLLYGKSETELNAVARRLYDKVKNITYIPVECELPYANPTLALGGNKVTINDISTYVMEITLSGAQLSMQTIASYGTQTRSEVVVDTNAEIDIQKYKVMKLTKTVDQFSVELKDIKTTIDGLDMAGQNLIRNSRDLDGHLLWLNQLTEENNSILTDGTYDLVEV